MAKRYSSIFDRQVLRPPQMRTVAERRFADADCLQKTKKNERANGAMYLGGFAIECLLKAKLVEKHKWLQRAFSDKKKRTKHDQRLYSLCYQKHDLEGLLAHLPHVTQMLSSKELLRPLQEICGAWTIFARYSPQSTTSANAKAFLESIKELKKWLR